MSDDPKIINMKWDNWPHFENLFWWTGGNASCDCNRSLWFERAQGEDEAEIECGDGAFSVRLTNADTGELLYNEFCEDEK